MAISVNAAQARFCAAWKDISALEKICSDSALFGPLEQVEVEAAGRHRW